MEQLLKLAENYVMQRVMSNHAPLTHTNKAFVVMAMFASIIMVASMGFALAGLYLWLSAIMPQFQALALFGGVLFALSLVIFAALAVMHRVREYKIQRAQKRIRDEMFLTFKLAESEFKDLELMENHPTACLALSSLAGFVLAEKLI